MKTVRRSAIAAVLMLAAGVGVTALTWGGGARIAFADVVEQVKSAKMLQCDMEMVVKTTGNEPTTVKAQLLMSDEGWMISSTPSVRTVTDASGKEMIVLDDKKTVIMIDAKNSPANAPKVPNLLTTFRSLPAAGSKDLGEKTIDGHKARGFTVDQKNQHIEIWADEATQKPLRITAGDVKEAEASVDETAPKPLVVTEHITSPFVASADVTFTNFDWNPARPSIADFQPPAGYKVMTQTVDNSPATENDVIGMLSTVADFDQGTLPEKIDLMDIMADAKVWTHRQFSGTPSDDDKKATLEKFLPIGRGLQFIAGSAGAGWTYGGLGVHWGEKKPVLWYQPAGGKSWHVFEGDGTMVEQAEKPAGGTAIDFAGKGAGLVPVK